MRIYFRDNKQELRCMEGDFGFSISEQTKLRALIKECTGITATLPIVEVLQ